MVAETAGACNARRAGAVEKGQVDDLGPANERLLSLASCWEMAIKFSLHKLRLPSTVEHFIPDHLAADAFSQLEIDFRHVATLPFHHRDPFDRACGPGTRGALLDRVRGSDISQVRRRANLVAAERDDSPLNAGESSFYSDPNPAATVEKPAST